MGNVYTPWLREGMQKSGTWTDENEKDFQNYYSDRGVDTKTLSTNLADQEAQNSWARSLSTGKSSQPIVDPLAQLEALKKAQLVQTIAGLDKSRSASLSNLEAEKATIEPQYQKQKIAANVTAKQTARSFDEYMAQRGGGAGRSGIAGQGTLMNNIAYQGQKGALDQGEASTIADNARRMTGVQNAYESDVAAANAGVEAQYLQNYISQMNTEKQLAEQQRQFEAQLALQQAGLTGVYNGQQTLQAQNQAFGNNLSLAQLTGMYNGQPTLASQQYQNSLSQQQFENDLALKQLAASQAKASSSSGSYGGGTYGAIANANSSTRDIATQIIEALQSGATIQEILNDIEQMERDGTAAAKKYDTQTLKNLVNSVPVDNWQYLPGY